MREIQRELNPNILMLLKKRVFMFTQKHTNMRVLRE